MEISKERLSVIGKLIGVYREEKRDGKQNNWTQIRFCRDICSVNTLKKIEAGCVGRSLEVYELLLKKFQLQCREIPIIDQHIVSLVHEIYQAIEYYDSKTIERKATKAIRLLHTVKDVVYYSDLYLFMKDLLAYYQQDVTINDKKVTHYLHIMKLFPDEYMDIMKVLIFSGIKQTCLSDVDLYLHDMELLDVNESKLPCLKMSYLQYYHIKNERYKLWELVKELEQVFQEENNYVRLLDVYMIAISSLSLVDKALREEYLKKIEMLFQMSETIPRSKCGDACANIGFSYYHLEEYEMALTYLLKSIEVGSDDLLTIYLIVADCQNHLTIPIDIPELDAQQVQKYPRELVIMYRYFLTYIGVKVPAIFQQKILMKQVAPLLVDPGAIQIFDFELKKLVKQTNNYKDLLIFQEIVEKNQKT